MVFILFIVFETNYTKGNKKKKYKIEDRGKYITINIKIINIYY